MGVFQLGEQFQWFGLVFIVLCFFSFLARSVITLSLKIFAPSRLNAFDKRAQEKYLDASFPKSCSHPGYTLVYFEQQLVLILFQPLTPQCNRCGRHERTSSYRTLDTVVKSVIWLERIPLTEQPFRVGKAKITVRFLDRTYNIVSVIRVNLNLKFEC